MSIPNLPVNFKDDILASSNTKRKYQQTFNSDGSMSLEDVTQYTQKGSEFGASQVNQTNGAVNNIYDERIVDVEDLSLVTEPGFFVDALAIKDINADLADLSAKTSGYTYSTDEVVIGKWIDGRNLYRKVFNIGQLTGSGGNTSKPHGIANFDRAIHLYGSARNTSLESRFTVGLPYPAVTSTQMNISLQANNTNIQIYHPSDVGNYSAVVVMEYIKTAD